MYFIHSEREDYANPLTVEQWKALVESDPEMIYTNTVRYSSPFGEEVVKSGGFYGIWTPKEYPELKIVFSMEDGVISVIYDSRILRKLYELSNKIEGFVYGDMGEEY